jgi:hypothetical protein
VIAGPDDNPSGDADFDLTLDVSALLPLLTPSERERQANERFRLGPEALDYPLIELDPSE